MRNVLSAVAQRRLCANAAATGKVLLRHLRRHGLEAWGVGLAVWYEPSSGGLQNAVALHCRMLPPLTLSAAQCADLVVQRGLYSHLPSLFNSALGRTTDGPLPCPAWADARDVVMWHAARIEYLDRGVHLPLQTLTVGGKPGSARVRRRAVAWGTTSTTPSTSSTRPP